MRRILLELDYEGQTYYISNSAYSGNLVYYPFLLSVPQIGIGGEGFAKVTTGQVTLSLNVEDVHHPFSGSRYYSLISSVQEIPFRLYLEEEDAPIFVGNLTLSEVTEEEIRFLVVEEKFETPLIHPVLDRDSRVEIENFYLFQPAGVTDAADWQLMVSAVNISLQDQEEMIFERFAASASLALLNDAFQELIYDKTKENSYLVAPATALNKRIMLADKEDQSKIITVRDLGSDPEEVLQSMGYTVTTTTSGSDTIYQVNSTAITSSYTHTVDSVLIYGYQDLIGTDTTASIHKPPTQPTNKYNIGPPVNSPFTFGEVTLRSPVIPYGDAKIKRDNQSFSAAGTGSFEPSVVTGSSSVSTNIQIFAEDPGQAGSAQIGGGVNVSYTTDNLDTGYITEVQVQDLNTNEWLNWQKDIPFRKIRFRVRETSSASTTGLLENYTDAPFENNLYGQNSTWPTISGDTWNVLDLGSDSDIASRDFNDKAKYRTAGQTETQTWTRGSSTSTGLENNSWGFWNSGFVWPASWSATGLYNRSSPYSYWYRKRELDGSSSVVGVVNGNTWLSNTVANDNLNNWNNYNRTLHYHEGNFGDRLRRVERDPENVGSSQDLTRTYYTSSTTFTTDTGFTTGERDGTYMLQYFKHRSTGTARLMAVSELISTGDYVRIDLVKSALIYTSTTITGTVGGTDIDSTSDSPYWGVKWGYIYRAFRGGSNVYYTWLPDGANPLTWQPSDSNYQKGADTDYGTDGIIGWKGRDPYNSSITTYGENSLRWYKTGSRYYNNNEYIQGSSGTWLKGQDLSDIAEVKISAYFKLQNEDYSSLETENGWFYKNEIYWKGAKIWEDPDYHLNSQTYDPIPYTERTIGSGNVPIDYLIGSTQIGSDTSTTTPDGTLWQRKRHLGIRYIYSQYFEIGYTKQVPSTTYGYGGIYIGTNSSNRFLIESSKVSGITKSDFTVNETYIDGDGITWSITLKTPEVYSTTFGTIEPDGSVTNQTAHRYDLSATRVLPAAWIYDPDNTYPEKFLDSMAKRLKAVTYNSTSAYYEMSNEVDSSTGDVKVYWTSGPTSSQWQDARVLGKQYTRHESTAPVVAEVPYIPITDEYRLENARTNIYKRAEEVWEADPDSHTGLGWSSISKKDEAYGVGWADGKSMSQSGSTTTETWYDLTASTKSCWEWAPDPGTVTSETRYNRNSGGMALPEYYWKLRLEDNGVVTLQIYWNDVLIHTQSAAVQSSGIQTAIGAIHDAGEDLWNLTEVTLSDGTVLTRDPFTSGPKYWTNFPNTISNEDTIVEVQYPNAELSQYWFYDSNGNLINISAAVQIRLDNVGFAFADGGSYTVHSSNIGTYKFIGFNIKKMEQGAYKNGWGSWGNYYYKNYYSKITLGTPQELYYEVNKSYQSVASTSGTLNLWVDGAVESTYAGTTTSWHQTKPYEKNSTEYLLTKGAKQTSPSGDSNHYWQIIALNTEVSGYYLSQLYIENDVIYESNYKTPIALSSSSTLIDGTNVNLPQHLDIDVLTQSPNMGTITSDLYNLYRIDNSVAEPVPLGVLKIPANHTSNSVKPNIDVGTQTYTSGSKTFYETSSSIKVNDGSYRDWLEYDSDLQSVTITLRCYAGTRVHELNFYTYSGLTLNKIADTGGNYPDGTISRQVDGYNDMPIPNGTQIIGIKLRNVEDDVDDYAKRIRGCDLYIKQRFFPEIGRTAVGQKRYAYVFCAEILDIQSAYGVPVNRYAKQSYFMDLFKQGVTTEWPFDAATDEVSVYAIRNPSLQVGFTPLTTTDYVTANWTPRVFDDGVELGLKKDASDSDPLSTIYIESSRNSELIYLSHNPFGQVALTGRSSNGSNIREFFNFLAIKLKAEKEDPDNRIGLVTLYFDDDVDYSMADTSTDGVLSYNLPIYTDSEMTVFEMAERVSANTNHQFFMRYFLNPADSQIYRKIYLVDINKSFAEESAYRALITQEIISIGIEFPYPIKAFESTLSRNVSYRATLSQNYESIMKEISSTYRIDGSGLGNVQQYELFAESFEEGKRWLRRFAEVGHSPKVRIEYTGVDIDLMIGNKISFKDELRHLDGFLVVQELQYNFESDSTTVSGIGKFEEIIHS